MGGGEGGFACPVLDRPAAQAKNVLVNAEACCKNLLTAERDRRTHSTGNGRAGQSGAVPYCAL